MSVRKQKIKKQAWRRYLDTIGPENYRGTGYLRTLNKWAVAWTNSNMLLVIYDEWRPDASSGNR